MRGTSINSKISKQARDERARKRAADRKFKIASQVEFEPAHPNWKNSLRLGRHSQHRPESSQLEGTKLDKGKNHEEEVNQVGHTSNVTVRTEFDRPHP